jgi:hypothetical protein
MLTARASRDGGHQAHAAQSSESSLFSRLRIGMVLDYLPLSYVPPCGTSLRSWNDGVRFLGAIGFTLVQSSHTDDDLV